MWADPDRLEQVVANLIENAVRHGDGTVTVDAATAAGRSASPPESVDSWRSPTRATASPPSDREQVFSRFWHGPRQARARASGLYVVRGLVEAHGGVIRAEEAPGGGARMRATFPDRD